MQGVIITSLMGVIYLFNLCADHFHYNISNMWAFYSDIFACSKVSLKRGTDYSVMFLTLIYIQ